MSHQNPTQLFGELRSTLQRPPSAEVWKQICELIDALHDIDPELCVDRAVPYTADHLDGWPVGLREVPERWLTALIDDAAVHPGLSLAQRLHVRMKPLTPPGLTQLFCSPALSKLRQVVLDTVGFYGASLPDLLGASTLVSLELLDLRGNMLGDDDIEGIESLPRLPSLSVLSLAHNDIGSRGAAALARSPWVARLGRLNLSGNHIGDEGALYISRSSYLSGVDIDLSANAITYQGAFELAHSTELSESVRSTWRRKLSRL